ncbi:MAG: hypothetical protein KGQ59_00875 [Bdellovibrionales bacterium]|nr:hypothetical protein [Bdellovibrionales bacterium]
MKTANLKLLVFLLCLQTALFGFSSDGLAETTSTPRDETEDFFESRRFTLHLKNAEIKEVLKVIAEKGALQLRVDPSVSGKTNLNLQQTTLAEALDRLAEQNSFEYLIEGDRLSVKKSGSTTHGKSWNSKRSPAEAVATAESGVVGPSFRSGNVREIPIQFAVASQILGQVKPLLEKEDMVILDELANSIIFQGSEQSYAKILEFIKVLDRLPQQVLIEAQVVETSRSFLQAFGMTWGMVDDPGLTTTTARAAGIVNAPGPNSPNGSLKIKVGTLGGTNLDFRLTAAESNGDARVISRPKVVTLNNTPATVDSGVSFYIKTLSSVQQGSQAAVGGVSRLASGLQLSVTPTIMGKDLVKLMININNSTPDEAQAVDGIPGIINNSAQTSVIISEGRTAVIAGLVKNAGGKSSAGVPILQNIPILGAFFRNSTFSDRNNELVIFITPQIVTPQLDLKPEKNFADPKLLMPQNQASSGGT